MALPLRLLLLIVLELIPYAHCELPTQWELILLNHWAHASIRRLLKYCHRDGACMMIWTLWMSLFRKCDLSCKYGCNSFVTFMLRRQTESICNRPVFSRSMGRRIAILELHRCHLQTPSNSFYSLSS